MIKKIFTRLGFERSNNIDSSNLSNYDSENTILDYSSKTYLKNEEKIFFSNFDNKDISILDIGCGGGRTTFALLKSGFTNIIGGDYSIGMIGSAKKIAQSKNIKQSIFNVIDATNLQDYNDNTFDVVFFSYNGIDYIPTKEGRILALNEFKRVLKPNGKLFYSFHNKYWISIYRVINLIRTTVNGEFFSGYEIEKNNGGFLYTKYSGYITEKNHLLKLGFKVSDYKKYNKVTQLFTSYMLYIEAKK